MKIRLEFQYFEGCPNHKKMSDNLTEALKGLEDKIELRNILVEDEETARRIGFIGSPTLLVNGKDLEGVPSREHPSLSCRFYPNSVPSVDFIKEKIIQELNKE